MKAINTTVVGFITFKAALAFKLGAAFTAGASLAAFTVFIVCVSLQELAPVSLKMQN